ncbi:MAG: hypothetical protein LBC45_05015 [Chlamydiales bacterium]|jgi:hypothetical protein|nr:hypothetical protein [Chlamydiales bacterium]
MNKILKIVTACLLLPVSFLCANTQEVQEEQQTSCCCFVENSFGYLNVGVGPLPELIPSLGIGYRAQKDHHGFDLSGSIAKTWMQTTVRAGILYNYFFKPNLESEFYAGLGIGMKGVREKALPQDNSYVAIYPELVFGKQYKNETNCQRFFQMQIGFPVFALDKIVKKTWTHRRSSYSVSYPTSYKTSYVPEIIFSYGIGF